MLFPIKLRNAILLLISWRLISVYVVQTFFVPDEYWQSLEVAHRLAFGYGYLTWEWRTKIRSYIYPFLISILYRALAFLGLDYTVVLTNLPRVFQAALSGYADYKFYMWTRSRWALLCLCANWFWYYCATRTLANSLETALTTVALTIFPWPDGRHGGSGFLWIVGFLTAVRPTAAILWAPLCIYHIFTNFKSVLEVVKTYGSIAVITLSYSILIDSICYGSFVITPWEFFRVNVLNSTADFYGRHHILWYFTAGLPVILGLQIFMLPPAVLGVLYNPKSNRQHVLMVIVIFWTLAVYSTLPHKEFRFILPLLPLFICIFSKSTNFPCMFRITEFRRKLLLSVFIISNLLPGLYISLIHQRGSLDVMRLLQQEFDSPNSSARSLMFLTPCHASPLYSHIHTNISIRFLTCEPNLENYPNYIDEADLFFKNPSTWLNTNIDDKNVSKPDVLVLFDNLSHRIMPFLKHYRLLAKIFHTHFPQSNYYGEYIEVYKRK